jgi:hypothetical protein
MNMMLHTSRYTHEGKVWNFLRYDRSNKVVLENEHGKNKTEQNLTASFGPVPLFKWPDPKVDLPEEGILPNISVNELFLFSYSHLTFLFQKKRIIRIIMMTI